MDPILIALVVLGGVALVFAAIIFGVEKKFIVVEDPRIDLVAEKLPGANCGGCGFAGCRNFAEAIVKNESLEGLFCPVGGNELSAEVAEVMGLVAEAKAPQVAVVRCQGSYANSPAKTVFEGATSCAYAHMLYSGPGGCPNGCLGLGDCVTSCAFDAMYMDKETGLPVILDDACVSCGACVKACPRSIIELRNKGPKSKRIYVSCVNTEKGAIAKKNCVVACIGCGKCVKVCPHEAIVLENNLAYIHSDKCKLCRKCVSECPTGAIVEINFPARKAVADAPKTNEENITQ
ncbi:MAG: ferredoxin [Bacteroidetes bacterium HGW-Bacteroidetes-6]|nr:MAG: ferredoxin [Bacteroidetes bacterium HGW-Bacteroidetes-6]